MKRISTDTAFEEITFSVGSSYITASVTGLACIVAVHEDYGLTEHLSFVFDEAEKLFCTPTSDKPSGLLSSFTLSFHTTCSQFFKGDSITILVNDCFRDAVVYISDEPSLSSANFLQMSFSGASACSLKASLQIFISPFYFTKMFTVEECVVGCDSRVINSPVHTNDFLDFDFLWSINIYNDVDEYSPIDQSDSCRIGFVERVFIEIRRNAQNIFPSAIDCAYADHIGIGEKSERIVVKPNRRVLFFDWFLFEFELLKHVACLVTHSGDEAAVEFRMRFPDSMICQVMQSCLVVGLGLHANVDALLARLVAQHDCSFQVIVSDDFSPYCDLHTNPLYRNLFKYVVVLCSYENQENKTRCLQYKLSYCLVSEVSEININWRIKGVGGENYKRGLLGARLGTDKSICSTRPHTCFRIYTTDILSDVHCEGFERNNCGKSSQGISFCEEVLVSELLCRNGWNCHRTNYSEVYSRTRAGVMSQFLTATRLQCPLAT